MSTQLGCLGQGKRNNQLWGRWWELTVTSGAEHPGHWGNVLQLFCQGVPNFLCPLQGVSLFSVMSSQLSMPTSGCCPVLCRACEIPSLFSVEFPSCSRSDHGAAAAHLAEGFSCRCFLVLWELEERPSVPEECSHSLCNGAAAHLRSV